MEKRIELTEIDKFLTYQRNFYLFGDPIQTTIGEMKFLTYKEYLMYSGYISNISKNSLHIYYDLIEQTKKVTGRKKKKEVIEQAERLKEHSIYQIVVNNEELLSSYIFIFSKVIGEDNIEKLFQDEETFLFNRRVFMDMNLIKEEEVSPNPEIQKTIEMSRKIKRESTKDNMSPNDIMTAIVAGTGCSFSELREMTVFQVFSMFQRYGTIKNYDATILFSTVSSEVDIVPWSASFNLFDDSSETAIKRSEFDEKTKDIF